MLKPSRATLADALFKRVVRNLTYLFSANFIVGLVNIMILAVMARVMGPIGVGVIALIEAYARSVDLFLRFETGQAVLRYGLAALEKEDLPRFRRLIKLTVICDFLGGAVAAIVAIGGASVASHYLQFDHDQTIMLICFSATLFVSVSSTPVALLRIFDKFDLLARFAVLLSLVRLVVSLVIWESGGELWAFVLLMIASQVAEQLFPLAAAWRELGRRGHGGLLSCSLASVRSENPNLISFIVNANINVVARTSTQRFDTLIVGGILGPGAAGIYQVAKRVSLAATQIGKPVQQAIYPEIARLWTRGEVQRFRRVIFHVNGSLAVVTVLVLAFLALFGEPLVHRVFGEAFAPATPLIIVQTVAVALFLSGSIFGPALLTMGEDSVLMRITLAATALFFGALVPAVMAFGALGASLAHVAFNLILFVGCLAIFLLYTTPAGKGNLNLGK